MRKQKTRHTHTQKKPNNRQAPIKAQMSIWRWLQLDREALLAREEEIRGQVVVCSLKDLRQLAALLLEALLL